MFWLNRVLSVFVVLLILGTLACGPEEDSSNQNQDPDTNQNTSQDEEEEEEDPINWDPQFVEVAEITQQTCAIPSCHGAEPEGISPLNFGANLDDLSLAAIQGIFESHQAATGRDLVVPGDADSSELYLVLISDDPDVFMPRGLEPLSEAQLATVSGWINDGAAYE